MIDTLKSRMKDMATYFDSSFVLSDVKKLVAKRSDYRGMMCYGMDLRKFINDKQSTHEKLSILNDQIALQCPLCIGDCERMSGSENARILESSFKEIDDWNPLAGETLF